MLRLWKCLMYAHTKTRHIVLSSFFVKSVLNLVFKVSKKILEKKVRIHQ